MDFFQAQDNARFHTKKLTFFFLLAVVAIVAAVNAAVCFSLYFYKLRYYSPGDMDPFESATDPRVFIIASVVTILVILIGSLWKIIQLGKGGVAVAEMMGAREVVGRKNPYEKRLMNVVEEMSIASGCTCPRIFIMKKEMGINAFAAGYSPSNSVIVVTEGCLKKLNRDELQGVVAHEFSHIINYDVRLNVRLIGILNGILCIGMLGYYILRSMGRTRSRSNSKGGSAIIFIFLFAALLIVIGFSGVFFARIIKASISRKREYLADASAVQFTRNPQGLGGALFRIFHEAEGSCVESKFAEELSHMFFSMSFKMSFLKGMFATHPPLEKRIVTIDPGILKGKLKPVTDISKEMKSQKKTHRAMGLKDKRLHLLTTSTILASVGRATEDHFALAESIYKSIPEEFNDILDGDSGLEKIIYALLLDREAEEIKVKQFAIIAKNYSDDFLEDVRKLYDIRLCVGDKHRLPLVEIIVPKLKSYKKEAREQVVKTSEELVLADDKISIFELALKVILKIHLDDKYQRVEHRVKARSKKAISKDVLLLLSALANYGADSESDARSAFDKCKEKLNSKNAKLMKKEDCAVLDIEKAIFRLRQTSGRLKKYILSGCVEIVIADKRLTMNELELLRAISSGLGCPVPPIK